MVGRTAKWSLTQKGSHRQPQPMSLSQKVREEMLPRLGQRHVSGGRQGRSRTIDELCEPFGSQPQAGMNSLGARVSRSGDPAARKGRAPKLGSALEEVLWRSWQAPGQPCSKRLATRSTTTYPTAPTAGTPAPNPPGAPPPAPEHEFRRLPSRPRIRQKLVHFPHIRTPQPRRRLKSRRTAGHPLRSPGPFFGKSKRHPTVDFIHRRRIISR